MKKQYLIGLLALVTVSIPLENGLLTTNTKSINATKKFQKLDSGIKISENSKVFFTDENKNNIVDNGDSLNSIVLDATYLATDRTPNLRITGENYLHFTYGKNKQIDLQYSKLKEYKGDELNEGYNPIYSQYDPDYPDFHPQIGWTFNVSINKIDDNNLFYNEKNIWNYKFQTNDNENIFVTTDANDLSKEEYDLPFNVELEIGSIATKNGYANFSNLNSGIVISKDSYVATTNNKISAIKLEATYIPPTPLEFKIVKPRKNKINIYEESNNKEPLYSINYNKVKKLDENKEDGKKLTIDLNSTEDYYKIFDHQLTKNNKNFIIAGEGISLIDSKNNSNNLIENYIGEVQIISALPKIETKLEITNKNEVKTTSSTAKVNYKITPGTDENGYPLKYIPNSIEWIDLKNDSIPFETISSNESTNFRGITTGTIEATNLKANKEYTNTKLVLTMNDNKTTIATAVSPFKTENKFKLKKTSILSIIFLPIFVLTLWLGNFLIEKI